MGLLDELEQEAQKRKASTDDVERRKAEREELFKTQLDPGMTALYEYLSKLTASLKVLQPKKALRYSLAGYGEIIAYVVHEYDLQVIAQPTAKEIKLNFSCQIASEECPTIEVQGTSKIKTLAGLFQRYHFAGLLESKKDANGEVISATFKARGKVTLSALFNADAENTLAKFSFANFDELGMVTKSVPPNLLTSELFDEIGRYLTREPNNLFRESLPESYRVQLRTKIQQEEMKRKWESKIRVQQQLELTRTQQEKSASSSLRRWVDQLKEKTGDKLRDLIKRKSDR